LISFFSQPQKKEVAKRGKQDHGRKQDEEDGVSRDSGFDQETQKNPQDRQNAQVGEEGKQDVQVLLDGFLRVCLLYFIFILTP
jgi:hypothetical protein